MRIIRASTFVLALLVSALAIRVPLSQAAAHPLWIPAPHTTWQWQLSAPIDQSVKAQMFDIDLFENRRSVVDSLHKRGSHVVCYLDAGSWENWRPDAKRFPKSVLGRPLAGWPGERWLDIRRLGVLGPIMRARFQMCASKHFDGVEADNVDGYQNSTGFALSARDQLKYNEWLATTAHSFGLSIALKNDLDQVPALLPHFDYALDEQCFEYSECGLLRPFVKANKAVFEVEYNLRPAQFCSRANTDGLMAMVKHLELGAWREVCW